MYSTIAKSAVNATMTSSGVTEDTFKDEAHKKVATLTKNRMSVEVAGNLIDAAVTEIKSNVAQSAAVELDAQDPGCTSCGRIYVSNIRRASSAARI